MLLQTKHILLVSYVFPPHFGIGGRRWAGHAEYMAKKGFTVHVITARNPFKKKSLWNDKVKNNPNIIIYELPSKYPKSLLNFDSNLFQKISYKFYQFFIPFFVKGNYYDRTAFWKNTMLSKAKEIISTHNINVVICSGGPFGALYYSTLLKNLFPNIYLLCDLRDPWTWAPNWGFPLLAPKRLKHEQNMEREMVIRSNKISVPTTGMLNFLHEKYPQYKNKIVKIPHFFVPEEIQRRPKTTSSKIRLIYYGTVYDGIEMYLEAIASYLGANKNTYTLDMYSETTFKCVDIFKKHKADNVRFFPQISPEKLFNKFENYDYVLLINPSYNINNISTKFHEIIYSCTPIIILSEKGFGPEFLVENNLGIHIETTTLTATLDKISKNELGFKYNSNYDVNEFAIDKVTNILLELITEEVKNKSEAHFPEPISTKKEMLHKDIILTFDYELFLGKESGTVYNCILKPTEHLLHVLDKYSFNKAIFFVDTTYIKRLTESDEPACKTDLNKIKNQLVNIIRNGHYVFPHLHPHWRDAIYDKIINQWRLEKADSFRFHVITEEERDRLFAFSIQFINELMQSADTFYSIDSFRAGGWCLQPFATYKPYFEKYGIKNDFSALRGFSLQGKNIFYDYSNIPLRNIYKFSDMVEIEDKNGAFNEIVISTVNISNISRFLDKVLYKYLWYSNKTSFGDGYSAVDGEASVIRSIHNMEETTKNKPEMASIELMTYFTLKAYKSNLNNNDFMHFISHPKMISQHNLETLSKFLEYAKSKYILNTDYKKMLY